MAVDYTLYNSEFEHTGIKIFKINQSPSVNTDSPPKQEEMRVSPWVGYIGNMYDFDTVAATGNETDGSTGNETTSSYFYVKMPKLYGAFRPQITVKLSCIRVLKKQTKKLKEL